MMTRLAIGMTIATTLLLTPPAIDGVHHVTDSRNAFHELTDNRATLVLRDGTHVSVTMYINFTEALHRALAPQRSLTEFVLTSSAMSPSGFRSALRRAQAHFVTGTSVVQAAGEQLVLSNWNWPDAEAVQAMLQQQTMQAAVAPNDHAHEQPMEIRVDAIASRPISTVTVRFPIEFQRVLVVSYKPRQVWVEPTMPSPRIRF